MKKVLGNKEMAEAMRLLLNVHYFKASPETLAWLAKYGLGVVELMREFKYVESKDATADDLYKIAAKYGFAVNVQEAVFLLLLACEANNVSVGSNQPTARKASTPAASEIPSQTGARV